MYSYIARRLAFGILTVVGVSIMVFVVMLGAYVTLRRRTA